MSDRDTRTCFVCHRERPLDKFTGHRCSDRASCFAAAAKAAPPRPSKRTLRQQYGNPEGGGIR